MNRKDYLNWEQENKLNWTETKDLNWNEDLTKQPKIQKTQIVFGFWFCCWKEKKTYKLKNLSHREKLNEVQKYCTFD